MTPALQGDALEMKRMGERLREWSLTDGLPPTSCPGLLRLCVCTKCMYVLHILKLWREEAEFVFTDPQYGVA